MANWSICYLWCTVQCELCFGLREVSLNHAHQVLEMVVSDFCVLFLYCSVLVVCLTLYVYVCLGMCIVYVRSVCVCASGHVCVCVVCSFFIGCSFVLCLCNNSSSPPSLFTYMGFQNTQAV